MLRSIDSEVVDRDIAHTPQVESCLILGEKLYTSVSKDNMKIISKLYLDFIPLSIFLTYSVYTL